MRAPWSRPFLPGLSGIYFPCSRVQPSAQHLANGLELLTFLVVRGQQEAPIAASSLSAAQVGTDHHEVQGVTHTVQVVLLQLGGGKQEMRGAGVSLRTSVRKAEDAAVSRLDMNRLTEQMEEATAVGRAGATERTGQAGTFPSLWRHNPLAPSHRECIHLFQKH